MAFADLTAQGYGAPGNRRATSAASGPGPRFLTRAKLKPRTVFFLELFLFRSTRYALLDPTTDLEKHNLLRIA